MNLLDAFLRVPFPADTPLLKSDGLWLKPEGEQPSGSVKYRMVHTRLYEAISSGQVGPGTTLLEVTSGSTGVALALIGCALGLPVELHAYEGAAAEKCARIRETGARLVLHPQQTPIGDLLGLVAARVQAGGAWHLNQYDRAATGRAWGPLAAEVVIQFSLAGRPPLRRFVCPVGTGGLIQGVGGTLRRSFPGLEVVAVEPEAGAVIDGLRNTRAVHLGAADPFDPAFPDLRVEVRAPTERVTVEGRTLGASATAAWLLARARGWDGTLIIAAD